MLDAMPEKPYDLLIRGGSVVDGTGSPGVPADVAVRGDRIAAIGDLAGEPALRTIDAAGRIVAPGFIDVHSHDDAAVLTTPMDFKLMQGVTTDIVGNCGAGIAPHNPERGLVPAISMVLGEIGESEWRSFGEYMSAVERAQPAINVACLVPHGVVRYAAIGMDTRTPEPEELDEMREHVREGMAAGAVGLSTGLIYPPGRFAETEEIVECAKESAAQGGLYVSHIRDEGERLMEAVEEAVRIGAEAGLPAQISHHKASGEKNWGRTQDSISYIEERRATGQDVTFDVYPYTAASTVLSAFIAQPEGADPDTVLLASVPGRPELEGKTLREAAEELDLPVDDATTAILREAPGAVAVFFTMDEADVQRVVAHEQSMIGSDGIPTPGGKPHPRLYGTFPRVLQKYVREERLLTLEEGVRKMTSFPARRFKLGRRGELREGWAADIVVFDAAAITDVATYDEPRQYPAGIDCVIVNGIVAAENGSQTERHAGTLVRRENS
ncbi:MAG: D-aminoacylase [Chloroflexi bacterium]|nr:MAG: D-aminoacylase [Chloroflexota bacterium]